MNQDRQNSQRRDAQNTEREQDFTTYRTAQSSNDMVPTVFRRGIYRTIRGSLKTLLVYRCDHRAWRERDVRP